MTQQPPLPPQQQPIQQHAPDQLFTINYEQLNAIYLYIKRQPWEEANPLVHILQNLPEQAKPKPEEPPEPLKVAPKPEEPSKGEPPPEAAKE